MEYPTKQPLPEKSQVELATNEKTNLGHALLEGRVRLRFPKAEGYFYCLDVNLGLLNQYTQTEWSEPVSCDDVANHYAAGKAFCWEKFVTNFGDTEIAAAKENKGLWRSFLIKELKHSYCTENMDLQQ